MFYIMTPIYYGGEWEWWGDGSALKNPASKHAKEELAAYDGAPELVAKNSAFTNQMATEAQPDSNNPR